MSDKLLLAANAAIEAGEAIMKVYNSGFDVDYKSDNSPLTVADKNANDVINSYLLGTDIPIISEENKQTDYQIRKDWSEVWIVDPLDGTKEFIKRNGEFTVNIALIKDGRPMLGVIFVPVTKTLFLGNVQKATTKRIDLKNFQTISEATINSVSTLKTSDLEKEKYRIVGSRSHMNSDTKKFLDSEISKGKNVEIVSKGSSLKFCLVAEGLADVYPRFAPTMEWDTAAGQAICEAVGVQVISLDTGQPLSYNKENLLNPYFIVGGNQ